MKALTFDPATDTFRISDLSIPRPGVGDVLVEVDACGLNPVDAKITGWKRAVPLMTDKWVPGLDVSGHILEVGQGVDKWKPGDRVLYHGDMFRPHGGYAEYAVQDARTLTPHPDVEAVVAAAMPCAGWTAWRALHDKLRADAHHSIFIAGGSGGVGGFALQLARHWGLDPIITTCSAPNHEYALGLGATHAIDYRTEDVVKRVMEITDGKGVSLGFDTVGPENDVLVADALAFEGEMVELVGVVKPKSYRDAFGRGLSFHQLSLGSGHRNGRVGRDRLVKAGQAFSELVEQGHVEAPALKTIMLEDVGDALVEMLERQTVGKIVMTRAK